MNDTDQGRHRQRLSLTMSPANRQRADELMKLTGSRSLSRLFEALVREELRRLQFKRLQKTPIAELDAEWRARSSSPAAAPVRTAISLEQNVRTAIARKPRRRGRGTARK